ncbi:hypothetical protein Bca4012_064606 [Brassica carinata]|uniref:Uncharacterized protein n=1 Tax=Brassica carinata TaxID=52824 RepID=A0A8X8AXX7_BRACI|nr:hypothetical protein Bca52824_017099 [Brassica carinata]
MKSKILTKGVARKGRSIVDFNFWKARGHHASNVNEKKLKFEKGVVYDCLGGSVSSGRTFIIEFKPCAYTVRWDEEGSREMWRNM